MDRQEGVNMNLLDKRHSSDTHYSWHWGIIVYYYIIVSNKIIAENVEFCAFCCLCCVTLIFDTIVQYTTF